MGRLSLRKQQGKKSGKSGFPTDKPAWPGDTTNSEKF